LQYPSTGIHFEACKGCVGLGALIAAAALHARQIVAGYVWTIRASARGRPRQLPPAMSYGSVDIMLTARPDIRIRFGERIRRCGA